MIVALDAALYEQSPVDKRAVEWSLTLSIALAVVASVYSIVLLIGAARRRTGVSHRSPPIVGAYLAFALTLPYSLYAGLTTGATWGGALLGDLAHEVPAQPGIGLGMFLVSFLVSAASTVFGYLVGAAIRALAGAR